MALLETFKSALAALEPGPSLAVGVSGGVDSICLMHLCAQAGLHPLVVHLDHGLRPESAREGEEVARQAATLGLTFSGRCLKLPAGPNLAQRAREARLSVWDSLAVDHVLLAHHLDDQAETVIDRLARGASTRGLSGIPARRGKLLRPLLGVRRDELLAFARAQGLRWMEDPSNRRGTRGAIRHRVLPALIERRPGAAAAIARSARLMAQDEDLLSGLAAQLLGPQGIDAQAFSQAHPALQRRALVLLVERSRGHSREVSAAWLEAATTHLDGTKGVLELGDGWRLVGGDGLLRCLPAPPTQRDLRRGRWGLWSLDATASVTLRPYRPGERIGARRVVDLLREGGVPVSLRPYHPIVEVADQRWLAGLAFEGQDPKGIQVRLQPDPQASPRGGGPYLWTL